MWYNELMVRRFKMNNRSGGAASVASVASVASMASVASVADLASAKNPLSLSLSLS